ECRDLRGEGNAVYDDVCARLRTSAASALISGSVSFFPKAGISSCPFVIERPIRASSILSCHFAFVRSRAFFFLPSSVWALPSSPWQTEQCVCQFSERASPAATGPPAARTREAEGGKTALFLFTRDPPSRGDDSKGTGRRERLLAPPRDRGKGAPADLFAPLRPVPRRRDVRVLDKAVRHVHGRVLLLARRGHVFCERAERRGERKHLGLAAFEELRERRPDHESGGGRFEVALDPRELAREEDPVV